MRREIPEHLITDQWREGERLLAKMILDAWTKVGVTMPLGTTKEAEEVRQFMIEQGVKAVFRGMMEVPAQKHRKKQPAE